MMPIAVMEIGMRPTNPAAEKATDPGARNSSR